MEIFFLRKDKIVNTRTEFSDRVSLRDRMRSQSSKRFGVKLLLLLQRKVLVEAVRASGKEPPGGWNVELGGGLQIGMDGDFLHDVVVVVDTCEQ